MFDKDLKKYPWLADFRIISDGFEMNLSPPCKPKKPFDFEVNLTTPCKPEKPLDDEFHFPSLHHKRFHRWEMVRVDKLIKGLESQFK